MSLTCDIVNRSVIVMYGSLGKKNSKYEVQVPLTMKKRPELFDDLQPTDEEADQFWAEVS